MNRHSVIVGGGVVGLATAFELTQRGWKVTIIDLKQEGRGASWASAGVLLPCRFETATHPLDRLCGLGTILHQEWAPELLATTGINSELDFSGGLYIARSPGESAALAGQMHLWSEENIPFEELSNEIISRRFPSLAANRIGRAVWNPAEGQIRSPRFLQSLKTALINRGARMILSGRDIKLIPQDDRITGVWVDDVLIAADQICLATGAWSGPLTETIGIKLPTTPVRGQILLYHLDKQIRPPIVNEGPKYIVSRQDGHVLVGSTMEEVGFQPGTSPEGIHDLSSFAESLVPALHHSKRLDARYGFRPATFDGLPYLGKLPGFQNGWIATGLFRIGLQASPAVARIVADLIEMKTPPMDIQPFRPTRVFDT